MTALAEAYGTDMADPLRALCLKTLEAARFDKVKPAREHILEALQVTPFRAMYATQRYARLGVFTPARRLWILRACVKTYGQGSLRWLGCAPAADYLAVCVRCSATATWRSACPSTPARRRRWTGTRANRARPRCAGCGCAEGLGGVQGVRFGQGGPVSWGRVHTRRVR
jgi:hypothetical protein